MVRAKACDLSNELSTRTHRRLALSHVGLAMYYPEYFPDPMCFYVGNNSDNFEEPLCICMPPALPLPTKAPKKNKEWFLSEVELAIPAISASETLTYYGKCDGINIELGTEHQLKLVFNQARLGKSMSFKPDLALLIEW